MDIGRNRIWRLVIATAVLLVCAHSLPLRLPTEEQPLREFKKVLKVAKSVLKSEFIQEFAQAHITDKKTFLNIVRSITNMAELQTMVNDMVENMEKSTSVKINVTKLLLDEAIDHACSWVKSALRDESFNCTRSELMELNVVLQVQSIMESLSDQLTDYRRLSNIDTCAWIHCNIACNPNTDPKVLDYITSHQSHPKCGATWLCPVPAAVQCPPKYY